MTTYYQVASSEFCYRSLDFYYPRFQIIMITHFIHSLLIDEVCA